MAYSYDPDGAIFAARRQIVTGNALGIAAASTWALAFPAAEILLQDWDPLTLNAVRFVLVTAFLVPLWALIEGPRVVLNARWGHGALLGGLTFGAGSYLLLVAQQLTDAVTVAILVATMPIAGAVIELVARTRRLRLTFVIGLALSVIGGVVATGSATVGNLGMGALVAMASVVLFALGSHYSVRDFPHLSPLGRTTITLAGGCIATVVALLVSHRLGMAQFPSHRIDAAQMGLLVVFGIAGMALSQVMWIATVGKLGVAVASFHINIVPFYVMLLMMMLGESWNWQRALGAAVVIAGVVLAQKRRRQQVP